jgi:alpha-tubulin suppressor-like RCC1 family protein
MKDNQKNQPKPLVRSKAVKLTRLLCFLGVSIFSTSLVEAQLINVDFNNNSAGAGHGGPNPGPTMSGAGVLGAAGDQWNGINVNSGTGISLIYADGSSSPVTMTFSSGGGYDANSFNGSTPFAATSYDALMEDYLFNGGTPQTITLSGLAPVSFYNLVLYNAGDAAAAGRITIFTVNGNTESSAWNASSSTLIAGTDYVEFKPALSDASGNLVITWTGNGSAEGDINGFQLQSVPMPPVAPAVTQISAGTAHGLFLKSDGSLWVMGDNSQGQLGIGSAISATSVPQQIVAGNVTTISAGAYHSLFRKSDGSLWAMGGNGYGQLGDGAFTNHYFPEQIVGSQVGAISAGGNETLGHSMFGKFHSPLGPGSLWTMGNNEWGQLGDGTTVKTNTPQEILITSVFGNAAVSAVSAGGGHSLYIRPGGGLWAMGWNIHGQLGDGTTNEQHVPEQIVGSNVAAIAAGSEHSLFIESDGSLWAMGNNQSGQLGNGTTTDQHIPQQIVAANVVAIAAGTFHSLFIKSDGSLWGMGLNGSGELGDGTFTERTVPEQILASNVVAVAAGYYYSLFLKSDGSLWGMGGNGQGQLGVPGIVYTDTPIRILPGSIFNGGFETGDFTAWITNGNFSFTGITTKGAYVHSGQFGAQLGPVGSLGYISQPVATSLGTRYLLSFWLNSPDGATPSEFLVSWNGTTLFDQTNLPAIGWTHVQLRASAAGPSTVQFGFRNDNSYFGLDDISIIPLVQPVITGVNLAGNNLVLNARYGQAGGTYFTLTSTNIALPLSQWTPVATNVLSVDDHFSITVTNAVTPGAAQHFYTLQMQD